MVISLWFPGRTTIGRQKSNEKHVTIRQPDKEETPTTNKNNICNI